MILYLNSYFTLKNSYFTLKNSYFTLKNSYLEKMKRRTMRSPRRRKYLKYWKYKKTRKKICDFLWITHLHFLFFCFWFFWRKFWCKNLKNGIFQIFDKLSSLCSQNFLFFKRLARKFLFCLEFLLNNLSSAI
jgi:hypothetical protein